MRRKNQLHILLGIGIFLNISCQNHGHKDTTAGEAVSRACLWLTNPDGSALFEKQRDSLLFFTEQKEYPTIAIDTSQSFQMIDGFGYTLTGGSALHLNQMDASQRDAILRELFGTRDNHIGVSYLRVSIGASDLDVSPFSYNDLPEGETDPGMLKFSLDPDRDHLIPVLKLILSITPSIKIMGSPWSPPAWMKTNHDTRGGSLKPEFYDAYALYFVKYIRGMANEGIPIDAITIQNEPLHPGNNPSLLMRAEDQADFIKNHLGPAFDSAGINTKIVIYDHNADRPDYPMLILDDPEARKYIDGTAFHLYGGIIDALTKVHNRHPDKNIYFTEQWIGAPADFGEDLHWHVKNLIIGATRNWSRSVLEWNLAADPNQDPHTDRGGCDRCLGAITIDGNKVTRNPAYYIIAHASKFVRPGSVRIASSSPETLPNVAFKTPTGNIVLIVLNDHPSPQTFHISYNGKFLTTTLNAGAAGTFVW